MKASEIHRLKFPSEKGVFSLLGRGKTIKWGWKFTCSEKCNISLIEKPLQLQNYKAFLDGIQSDRIVASC